MARLYMNEGPKLGIGIHPVNVHNRVVADRCRRLACAWHRRDPRRSARIIALAPGSDHRRSMKTMLPSASGERNGLAGMLVLVLVLLFAIYFAASTTSEPSKNVALGVIGSLIASLVFAYVSQFVDTPALKAADRLAAVIDRVEAREAKQAERLDAGVLSVRAKYQFSPDFWFDFVEQATTRLDLVGHVLSGWTGPEMRERFGQDICAY